MLSTYVHILQTHIFYKVEITYFKHIGLYFSNDPLSGLYLGETEVLECT